MTTNVRSLLVRRGLGLTYATLAYNSLECLVAIRAGLAAGSIALVGFGVDSVIELAAGVAALWRLRMDSDPTRREQVEQRVLRFIGLCFLALAGYVTYEAAVTLLRHEPPAESLLGIGLAAASVVVMPLLARAKREVAFALGSGALAAEATQTAVCTYLSAILLAGLALNAALGWWWADPVAALAMVPLISREGLDGVRGRSSCCDPCATPLAGGRPRSGAAPSERS
ncbi:MAG TPA: cation transporter [Gemmatimonadales bacterium]|nr:cation transporter [Gemmatimonadales bacterium]